MYQTKNGPKSVAQMRDELRTAGYPNWEKADEAEIVRVYASTTGGAVTPAGSGTPPASGGGTPPARVGTGTGNPLDDAVALVQANPAAAAVLLVVGLLLGRTR